jgi:hypothetical protein
MADPSIDVERVVREVLAEMGIAPGPQPAPACAAPPVPQDDQRVISSRLVTIADLGDGLSRVRQVVVPAQAVVTPAVRDEIMRRGIVLVRRQPGPIAAAGSTRLVLVGHGKSYDPANLVAALRHDGIDVDLRRWDCVIAASDDLAAELAKDNTLGVLLTHYAAAGLCVANRLSGVRAVLAGDAAETALAAESVGANLLVISPRGTTLFQQKHLIREFVRGGVRRCPDALKQRLA